MRTNIKRHTEKQNRKRFDWKKRSLRYIAVAMCLALFFGQAGALLAAEAAAPVASKDAEKQSSINETAKELFTLAQIRDLARSSGSETLKAKSDLAIAQASMDAADMSVNDAWDNIGSSYASLEAAKEAQEAVMKPPPTPSLPGFSIDELLEQVTTASIAASMVVSEVMTATQKIIMAEGALISAEIGLENALNSLDDAKATAESQAEAAIYAAEELFFTYLQLNDTLATLDKTMDLSRDQIKIEEIKAKIGLSTGTEVQKKQLALSELTDKRQNLANAIDLTGRSLMRQIGKAEDTAFRLDPSFSLEGLKTSYDPDELAAQSVKNSLMLKKMDRVIDQLKDAINSDISYTQKNQYGAQADSLILDRDNAIQGMKLLARTTATGLDTARAEMSLLEKKIAEKQVAFDVMALQVALGLAPKVGLSAMELDLFSAQNDLKKAKQDYYLSLRKAALLVKGVTITGSAGR